MDEISGSGNHYDFGARMYDSRIGRWMSVDPLTASYPSQSSYGYAGNSPIKNIEVDGAWYAEVHLFQNRTQGHEGIIVIKSDDDVVLAVYMAGGRGAGSAVNPLGSDWTARRQVQNGDTPLGTWNIGLSGVTNDWQEETAAPVTSPSNNARATYGQYRLWLSGFDGDDSPSRDENTIRWHAAEYTNTWAVNGVLKSTGRLMNTHGCVRSCLEDVNSAQSLTSGLNEAATTFSVQNDFDSFGSYNELTAISDMMQTRIGELDTWLANNSSYQTGTQQQQWEYQKWDYYQSRFTNLRDQIQVRLSGMTPPAPEANVGSSESSIFSNFSLPSFTVEPVSTATGNGSGLY